MMALFGERAEGAALYFAFYILLRVFVLVPLFKLVRPALRASDLLRLACSLVGLACAAIACPLASCGAVVFPSCEPTWLWWRCCCRLQRLPPAGLLSFAFSACCWPGARALLQLAPDSPAVPPSAPCHPRLTGWDTNVPHLPADFRGGRYIWGHIWGGVDVTVAAITGYTLYCLLWLLLVLPAICYACLKLPCMALRGIFVSTGELGGGGAGCGLAVVHSSAECGPTSFKHRGASTHAAKLGGSLRQHSLAWSDEDAPLPPPAAPADKGICFELAFTSYSMWQMADVGVAAAALGGDQGGPGGHALHPCVQQRGLWGLEGVGRCDSAAGAMAVYAAPVQTCCNPPHPCPAAIKGGDDQEHGVGHFEPHEFFGVAGEHTLVLGWASCSCCSCRYMAMHGVWLPACAAQPGNPWTLATAPHSPSPPACSQPGVLPRRHLLRRGARRHRRRVCLPAAAGNRHLHHAEASRAAGQPGCLLGWVGVVLTWHRPAPTAHQPAARSDLLPATALGPTLHPPPLLQLPAVGGLPQPGNLDRVLRALPRVGRPAAPAGHRGHAGAQGPHAPAVLAAAGGGGAVRGSRAVSEAGWAWG